MLPRPTTHAACVDVGGNPGFGCVAVENALRLSRGRFFIAVLEIPGFGGSLGCAGACRLCLDSIGTIAFGE